MLYAWFSRTLDSHLVEAFRQRSMVQYVGQRLHDWLEQCVCSNLSLRRTG